MGQKVERREYGKESSMHEKKLIQDQVYMLNDMVIYWKEVPVMSVWQVQQFGQKIDKLLKENNLKKFSILIDLTDSSPPNSKIRIELRNVFIPLKERGIAKAVAFTEKNFLINAAAKFVLGGSGLDFTVYKHKEDALKEINSYE